jgi:hypothetical protein
MFETDDTIETSDAITMLPGRLDAVKAELEDIRAGIASLRQWATRTCTALGQSWPRAGRCS